MEVIFVGIGGCLGSLARYWLGRFIMNKWNRAYPLGTYVINITGAFLLGIIGNMNIGRNYLLFTADGFLGAYTTFSTFMYEGIALCNGSQRIKATFYILSSILFGIIGYMTGMYIAGC